MSQTKQPSDRRVESTSRGPRTAVAAGATTGYEAPRVEVVSLSCEISAYAPDEDEWPPF